MSFFAFPGLASAHSSAAAQPAPECVVHSNPSMVEMGEGLATHSSIADIIQVECKPVYSERTVTIDAKQLFNLCKRTPTALSWYSDLAVPLLAPGAFALGPQFTVSLDNDGNATAAVWGGPSCSAGTALILASLNVPPFTTATTTFTILPPQDTPLGVTANPSSEVEDSIFSGVATVIQVEFPSVQAEQLVDIKSQELFSRCLVAPHLIWVGPNEVVLRTNAPEVDGVPLDNNGNAFVVVLGLFSCASGPSTITADLESAPYTTYTTTFTILSPRPTCCLRH